MSTLTIRNCLSFYTKRWAAIATDRYKQLVVGVDSQSNGCPFLYASHAMVKNPPNNERLQHGYV
jgi:hypothetical protein